MHLWLMTMVRLREKQRAALADTLRQLGNLVIGGLVVGQFVATRPLSWGLMAIGTLAWTLCVGAAMLLLAGAE